MNKQTLSWARTFADRGEDPAVIDEQIARAVGYVRVVSKGSPDPARLTDDDVQILRRMITGKGRVAHRYLASLNA